MVREIVHIQVGQCGNQLGNAFWDEMRQEHNINTQGNYDGIIESPEGHSHLDKISVYYSQPSKNRFVPRSVMVDLEPGIIDVIKSSPMGKMFKQDNFVFGQNGANNNWAKGFYTDGAEMVDQVTDVIRKEIESCDCPQGFELTHSLGGGTGSGLGTLTLLKLRDNYPDRIITGFSVFPHPIILQSVVEPYNAVLAINQILDNVDQTFGIDNSALDAIANDVLKMPNVRYKDLNNLVSMVMCGITASLRFPGKLNGDLRKMGVNLVPFPRLHFFQIGQAPLMNEYDTERTKVSLQEITDQMWSYKNSLVTIKPDDGKYIAASCVYRGEDLSTQEVDDEVSKLQAKRHDDFVSWIPNNIKTSIISVAPKETPNSGTFVANSTAIKSIFERTIENFRKLYKRKAYLHWYKGEGMDEMEFRESSSNIKDLCQEYQDKQDVVPNIDGQDEEIDDDASDDNNVEPDDDDDDDDE